MRERKIADCGMGIVAEDVKTVMTFFSGSEYGNLKSAI
jgi:hypothetical protein